MKKRLIGIALSLILAAVTIGFVNPQQADAGYYYNYSCYQLTSETYHARNVVQNRFYDIRNNANDLNYNGTNSVEGHRTQFRGWQARLRNLLYDYSSQGCRTGYPSNAWSWATTYTPLPRDSGRWNCWGKAPGWFQEWGGTWKYYRYGDCDFNGFGGGGGFGSGGGGFGGGGGGGW